MKTENNNKKSVLIGAALLLLSIILLAGITGCSRDNSVQSPSASSGNLSFSSASGNTMSNGTSQNILFIQEAKVMINDLKIHPEGDDNEMHGENIKIGPFVITLSLDSKVTLVTNTNIPPGTYRKVKFEIHRLQGNEPTPDPDFIDADGRYSVVVKGTFNGISFTYKSRITANQKETLQKPFVLGVGAVSNLTFFASPYDWFTDSNNNILDPSLPANRLIIEDNIRDNLKNHIHIFIDNDCNGAPDGGPLF